MYSIRFFARPMIRNMSVCHSTAFRWALRGKRSHGLSNHQGKLNIIIVGWNQQEIGFDDVESTFDRKELPVGHQLANPAEALLLECPLNGLFCAGDNRKVFGVTKQAVADPQNWDWTKSLNRT